MSSDLRARLKAARKAFRVDPENENLKEAFEEAKQALRQAKKCKSRSSPKPASTEKKNSHEVGVKSGEVDGGGNGEEEEDYNKIFVSRLPRDWNDERLKRVFSLAFGQVQTAEVSWDKKVDESRGFGFVVFEEHKAYQKAIEAEKLKRNRHKIQIRPIDRSERLGRGRDSGLCFQFQKGTCQRGSTCRFIHEGVHNGNPDLDTNHTGTKVCYEFQKGKCQRGEKCKFIHEVSTTPRPTPKAKKCFLFKKGKCTAGVKCPFRHIGDVKKNENGKPPCLRWKKKGTCSRADECAYAHDPQVREKVLKRKAKRQEVHNSNSKRARKSKSS
ncbi:hypothetical protein AAMO2058_001277900 [Amorphochlora amoebiformis]